MMKISATSHRIVLGGIWVCALLLTSSAGSALEIQYADPASGGPALLRGVYRLSCYQYVCSDQGVTGDDAVPPYAEFTKDIDFATDPSSYSYRFFTGHLGSDSIEAMAVASGRSTVTGNEYGDLSISWGTREMDIQIGVDEDTTFRFSASVFTEGEGEASIRLFGPTSPRNSAVDIRLFDDATTDTEITLLSGVLYTLSATADSRKVRTNDTARGSFSLSLVPIPEPGTGVCLGIGLLGLALRRPGRHSS